MITNFVLNEILHHVGISWIICSNNEMFYEIKESDHPNWFNTGPWYNPAICSKLHGKLFEHFMRHARANRYHIMCSRMFNKIFKQFSMQFRTDGFVIPRIFIEPIGMNIYFDFI